MARKQKNEGFGRLLDAWMPPEDAGDPVGCIATSFTFSPVHFEEQCLSRFLRLETDPDEDGPLYLIDREDKLSQVNCAAALVDQHHCAGLRSLRWDLLSIRPPRGAIQHAKVSLLCWAQWTRVIIGSANLTEDGYRRNREVYGVLDYYPGGDAPRRSLREVVHFLEGLLTHADGTGPDSPAVSRCRHLLDRVRRLQTTWSGDADTSDRRRIHVVPVFTSPAGPPALRAIVETWPTKAPLRWAWVASPFFDPPDAQNRAAQGLWSVLAPSGETEVAYSVLMEDLPAGGVRAGAPRSLLEVVPARSGARVSFARLADDPARPFHAKTLWLENDSWAGYMIGSSNFTARGLGLAQNSNFEANLLYLVNRSFCRKGYKSLYGRWPADEEVDTDQIREWQPLPNEDAPEDMALPLPEGFESAAFGRDDNGRTFVRLRLAPSLPAQWRLTVNETDELFYDDRQWMEAGSPLEVILDWQQSLPPYGFTVYWDDPRSGAWWPVNVESPSALPPPDELRDLPLEVLLSVLTSARPLHQALAAWLRRRRPPGGDGPRVLVDPHERVDTSVFLLQRTRRVSWALTALRERLSRPVATRESLWWRLYGPIGVEALAAALLNEGRSEEEKAFLLAELALELGRVAPATIPGAVPADDVRAELRGVISALRERVSTNGHLPANLRAYIDSAFEGAGT